MRAIAFNRKSDANAIQIQELRKEAFKQFKNRDPFTVLKSVEQRTIQTQEAITEFRKKVKHTLERIESYSQSLQKTSTVKRRCH